MGRCRNGSERAVDVQPTRVWGTAADGAQQRVPQYAKLDPVLARQQAADAHVFVQRLFARSHQSNLVSPLLLGSAARPVQDENDMLQKEAVFTAAGRLARSLVDNEQIPPAQFIAALAEEAKTSPHRVLKRRIAWLVGE